MAEITDLDPVDANNTARFPEGMTFAAVNNAARALEGILARWFRDFNGSIASSGSSNAYTITSNRTIAALADNLVLAFTANHTNSGTSTLSLNGLTAKAIRRPNGDALESGDIVSGQVVMVVYESSADLWYMLSPGRFSASDTLVGGLEIATLAEVLAASSAVLAVTPGRMHNHPGVAKAGGRVASDGTLVETGKHNVTSVVRNSTGVYTVTLAVTMADAATYSVQATVLAAGDNFANVTISSTTVFVVRTFDASDGAVEDVAFCFEVKGPLA